MRKFDVIAYTKSNGTIPINEFLYTLSEKMRAKALRELDLLVDYGNELREPYTKHIDDGIFELRIKLGLSLIHI